MTLRDLHLTNRRVIEARWLEARFSRASGPGGQHVNKTETRVDLRLDLACLPELVGEELAERARGLLEARIDKDGKLYVQVSEHRDRLRNVEVAHLRMEALLKGALAVQRARRATRPSRGSVKRRLEGKRKRANLKGNRQKVDPD